MAVSRLRTAVHKIRKVAKLRRGHETGREGRRLERFRSCEKYGIQHFLNGSFPKVHSGWRIKVESTRAPTIFGDSFCRFAKSSRKR